MASLRIQVLGTGLIPRGLGLAPRKEPFPADFTLIGTIMATNGLKVNFLNPTTNKFVELTNKNVKQMWDKYSDYDFTGSNNVPVKETVKKPVVEKTTTPPVVPVSNDSNTIEKEKEEDEPVVEEESVIKTETSDDNTESKESDTQVNNNSMKPSFNNGNNKKKNHR